MSSRDAARALLERLTRTYYGALGALLAGRREEADARQAELAAAMDEARRLLHPPIPWSQLLGKVRNGQGGTFGEREAKELLRAFRGKGQRPWYGWSAPVGLPHEDPARNETWGPRSPDEVDWTGFDAR
jgi:hypothetical protein